MSIFRGPEAPPHRGFGSCDFEISRRRGYEIPRFRYPRPLGFAVSGLRSPNVSDLLGRRGFRGFDPAPQGVDISSSGVSGFWGLCGLSISSFWRFWDFDASVAGRARFKGVAISRRRDPRCAMPRDVANSRFRGSAISRFRGVVFLRFWLFDFDILRHRAPAISVFRYLEISVYRAARSSGVRDPMDSVHRDSEIS